MFKMKSPLKLPLSIIFLTFIALILPFFPFNKFSNSMDGNSDDSESSVWCYKSSNKTNLCKFKNIYYDPEFKALLFVLGKNTVIRGIENYEELQNIQLSSLVSHNHFFANLSVIKLEDFNDKANIIIESKSLLMSRFKPNNIMHCIHDDLFPIFLTLENICSGDEACMKSYRLVFHDHHPKGPFMDFFNLFSNKIPILLNELPSNINQTLCFKEMVTGLVKEGVFYEYGFEGVQGPVKPLYLTQTEINRFVSYIKSKLKMRRTDKLKSDILLINRHKNRRILNIEDLKKMLMITYQKAFSISKVKIVSLDLQTNGFESFIEAALHAKILIGMHGAEIIFGLFMKPKSIIVEIFPFGIQPHIVSFIKPISELEGTHLNYFSWVTTHKNSSIPHPDAHPVLGGISHLDYATQEKIKNMDKVPAVRCCNDPAYLYHMYQDTLITDEFKDFLNESMGSYFSQAFSQKLNKFQSKWFYPYTVRNVKCEINFYQKTLQLNWCPPFNVKENSNLTYSLYLNNKRGNFLEEYSTQSLNLEIRIQQNVESDLKFQGWIKAYFNDYNKNKSPDVFFTC